MESIEQMIKRLCPKGVEWKKISEICVNICSGGTPSRGNSDYYSGNIPWLRTQEVNWTDVYDTELKISEEAVKNSSAKIIPSNCVIVAMYGATAAKVCINKIELTTNQACCNLQIDPEKALYKYVYFWLCNNYEKLKSLGEGSQNNLNAMKIKDYPIPIPPLEIQSRIVEVLDKMTTLTAELESELEAELETRKQQYEYYRNKLLSFSENGEGIRQVTWKTLGETCTILTGGEPFGNIIKGGKSDSMHPYAIFGNGAEIYGWSDTYRVGTDAVTISSIGANTGTIYYRKGPFTPIIRLKVILPGENLSQRFLYHILKTIKIKKKKSSVPNMNANEIKSILIPVPSMEEQERIVSILDRFEALTTDLQSGLPAEIEARRQQYEYYRDKLLTFEAV